MSSKLIWKTVMLTVLWLRSWYCASEMLTWKKKKRINYCSSWYCPALYNFEMPIKYLSHGLYQLGACWVEWMCKAVGIKQFVQKDQYRSLLKQYVNRFDEKIWLPYSFKTMTIDPKSATNQKLQFSLFVIIFLILI